MLQIDNHEEKALEVVVPYLHQFPELVGLAKNSGTRAQNIEDVAWELLWDLDIDTAHGIWLDYLGAKVGQKRTYSPEVSGAFTFGGTSAEGFGAGKFLSSSITGNSTQLSRSDENFRQAIKAKIIQNNTDCSLDEILYACKLLYNAGLVLIIEDYPAGISDIYIYGSQLIKSSTANAEIKKMMATGVSLGTVHFLDTYNIFKNNAFIQYNYTFPQADDFELSFYFYPDTVSSADIALLSQSSSFSSTYSSARISYSSSGVDFDLSPEIYNVGDTGDYYSNGSEAYYSGSVSSFSLSGGSINENEANTIKITREAGTTLTYLYKLYVNDILVDSEESDMEILNTIDSKLLLGVADIGYYNSGSIYSLYLKNNTTNTIIINDPLQTGTTYGTNNGVRFL